jgi:hypothetical protein
MVGHRRFDELKDALLRVPGAAERIAAQRRTAEEQIHRHEADGGAPSPDAAANDGSPTRGERAARNTKPI